MDKDKIILFTVIESDYCNTNNNFSDSGITTPRLYEQEAIKCFTQWRQKGGWLKDIPIICWCPTNNRPTLKTINKLKELGIIYIDQTIPQSFEYTVGFFHVPIVGKLLEELYPLHYLIHIDLDMNIIKPIPEVLFNDNVYCGQYDPISQQHQRDLTVINKDWKLSMDTGFTISHTSHKFYNMYYDVFTDLLNNYKNNESWNKLNSSIYNLEEFAMDILFYKQGDYNLNYEIKSIIYYQLGEGYIPYDEVPKNELNNILFWHEHIYENSQGMLNDKIRFLKRLNDETK
ncbi:MAG: hypothetical protein WC136_01230 [Sphaerochaeta sp.]